MAVVGATKDKPATKAGTAATDKTAPKKVVVAIKPDLKGDDFIIVS